MAGTNSVDVEIGAEGISTLDYQAEDQADFGQTPNVGSGVVTVKIDKTAPSVEWDLFELVLVGDEIVEEPVVDRPVTVGADLIVRFTCEDSVDGVDDVSGVDETTCPDAAPLVTDGFGSQSMEFTVKDLGRQHHGRCPHDGHL